jgi:hypothetical protein
MLLAVAPDGQLEPFGQRVDDRDADAVEAARDLVGIVVAGVLELPARVELGHDDLGGGDAFALVDPGRDPAAIVLDADRAVGVEVIRIRSQWPASASSIALSLTSNTMWCRPEPSSVSPMYMPGRLRTASRPLSTLIDVGAVATRRSRQCHLM